LGSHVEQSSSDARAGCNMGKIILLPFWLRSLIPSDHLFSKICGSAQQKAPEQRNLY
jgi:hypothetical protein